MFNFLTHVLGRVMRSLSPDSKDDLGVSTLSGVTTAVSVLHKHLLAALTCVSLCAWAGCKVSPGER